MTALQKELTQKAIDRIRELKQEHEHIESYGPFNIYESIDNKYYAVFMQTGSKSKEFETLGELYNSINHYLGIH